MASGPIRDLDPVGTIAGNLQLPFDRSDLPHAARGSVDDLAAYVSGAFGATDVAARSSAAAAASAASAAQTTASAALSRGGGTMTGAILLAADGTSPLHPASRQQLDAEASARSAATGANATAAAAAQATASAALPKAGGTMTGFISLSASGSSALHPVAKQQLDAEAGARTAGDATALHSGTAGEINGLAAKVALVGADKLLLEDSEAGFAKKFVTLTALLAYINDTGGGGAVPVVPFAAWPRTVMGVVPASWTVPTFTNHVYVSPSGNNSNAGTIGAPLLTIAAALTKAVTLGPGTEIIVRGGDYPETNLNITADGTSGAWYALRGYPGERPKIKGSTTWYQLSLQACYWLIEGFELDGSKYGSTSSDGVVFSDYTALNTWGMAKTTCMVTGENCAAGLLVKGSVRTTHHYIVRDMVTHDFPGAGISATETDYGLFEDILTYNNANYDLYGQSGLTIHESKNLAADVGEPYRMIIRRCVSHDNLQLVNSLAIGQNQITDGNGFIVDRFKEFSYAGRTLIENCISFLNGGSGIHALFSIFVDFVNCTTYMNCRMIDSGGEIFQNLCTTGKIRNCIAHARTGRRANDNFSNSGVTSNANIWYNGPAALVGTGDLTTDPQLKNPAAATAVGDFAPLASSPAINSADVVGAYAARDIFGRLPIGAKDRGAIEYGT